MLNRAFAKSATVSLCLSAFGMFSGLDEACAQSYIIRVINLTPGQTLSAPLAVTHQRNFRVFRLGKAASPGLQLFAEEGDPRGLLDELSGDSRVRFRSLGGTSIAPRSDSLIATTASVGNERITVLSNLTSTNDGFVALREKSLPTQTRPNASYRLRVYDAGTEANSESCSFIPGPPCGAISARDKAPAEGRVQYHAGLKGSGDLDVAAYAWPRFAARVRIRRIG